MIISWEIDDGYAGQSRPQSVDVPDEDIIECGRTLEDAITLISEYVQDDFEYKITWCFKSYDRMVKEIEELISKKS